MCTRFFGVMLLMLEQVSRLVWLQRVKHSCILTHLAHSPPNPTCPFTLMHILYVGRTCRGGQGTRVCWMGLAI